MEVCRDLKAWIIAPPRVVDLLHLPSVSEPFLAWSISGEVEFQEREGKRPWITHRIEKGLWVQLTAVRDPKIGSSTNATGPGDDRYRKRQ